MVQLFGRIVVKKYWNEDIEEALSGLRKLKWS